MQEAEIQPFVAAIGSGGEIMLFLFLGHSVPLRRPLLIRPYIKYLRQHHDCNVIASDCEEDFVA